MHALHLSEFLCVCVHSTAKRVEVKDHMEEGLAGLYCS